MNAHRKYFKYNLGGKERPIKLGINTSQLFCEKIGCELDEVNDKFSLDKFKEDKVNLIELHTMIWAGLIDGQRYHKKNLDNDYEIEEITLIDVNDWIEDLDFTESQKFIGKLFDIMFSSIVEVLKQIETSENGEKKN